MVSLLDERRLAHLWGALDDNSAGVGEGFQDAGLGMKVDGRHTPPLPRWSPIHRICLTDLPD